MAFLAQDGVNMFYAMFYGQLICYSFVSKVFDDLKENSDSEKNTLNGGKG